MTRREALLALGLMYALLVAGVTWQFGPLALAISGVAGLLAVAFLFERVEPSGEAVPDAVSREVLAALERDFSL
jgi:hypothetical protein